jgi:hypothetical protein
MTPVPSHGHTSAAQTTTGQRETVRAAGLALLGAGALAPTKRLVIAAHQHVRNGKPQSTNEGM